MEDCVYDQLFELEDSHWWFRGRRQVIWAVLRRAALPSQPEILDAGCGTGRNLVEYGPIGNAAGVDPSPAAIAFCRRRGLRDVFEARLEALPFDDGRFDLTLVCDVIEHIEDDRAALAELHRVAAPGGQLLITVPAYMWLWSQHDETHHHKRRYTLRALRQRVRASGFEPRLESYFNSVLLPPIALARATTRRSPPANGRSDYELAPPALNRWLELPMRAEARLIERGVRLPAGVSIAMLCDRR
jgi:SAM-dependent methyltransferase